MLPRQRPFTRPSFPPHFVVRKLKIHFWQLPRTRTLISVRAFNVSALRAQALFQTQPLELRCGIVIGAGQAQLCLEIRGLSASSWPFQAVLILGKATLHQGARLLFSSEKDEACGPWGPSAAASGGLSVKELLRESAFPVWVNGLGTPPEPEDRLQTGSG